MKKLRIIIIIGLMCITALIIQYTYSKYLTEARDLANLDIYKWNININNQNITQNTDFSNTLAITYIPNQYISSNVIAPNSTGYFDLVLNSEDTDLDYTYSISIDPSESIVPDVILTSYSINNGEIINLTTNSNTFSGTVYKNDPTHINSFRIYIIWDDSVNNILDNANDVAVSKSISPMANINVSVNVTQCSQ